MMAPIVKEGPGCKLGRLVKNWKNRWFVLQGTTVRYYVCKGGKLKGQIRLEKATNIDRAVPTECAKQPAFKVQIGSKRTYFIHVEPGEVDPWLGSLKQAVAPTSAPAAGPVSLDDFELIRVIRRGLCGKMQLVRFKRDGKLYALKSLRKAALCEAGQLEQAIVERKVLTQTAHPFLVGAHYAFQTADKVFLVLDHVPGGSLLRRLREEQRFPEPRARLYAAEVLLGLGHLHAQDIIYRDLKPENILVDEHGHLRVTNFSLAKADLQGALTTTFCGTSEYMAPEIVHGKPYTRAVDWWSFGVLLFEMLSGTVPFFDPNSSLMFRMIVSDPVEFPGHLSEPARDLIGRLLEKDPGKRLGAGDADFAEVKRHRFFEAIDFERLMRREIEPEWKPTFNGATDVGHFQCDSTAELPEVSYNFDSVVGSSLQIMNFTFYRREPF
jgi:serine/threonine protein kinase